MIILIMVLMINMYMCMYMHTYMCQIKTSGARCPQNPANLRTETLDFGGSDSGMLSVFRGGILVPAEFPRNVGKTNLSRDD